MSKGLFENAKSGHFFSLQLLQRLLRCDVPLHSLLDRFCGFNVCGVCSVVCSLAAFAMALVVCSCANGDFSDDSTSSDVATLGGEVTLLIDPDALVDAVAVEVTLSGYKGGAAEDYCVFYIDSSGSTVLAESPFGLPPEDGTWQISVDDDLWKALLSGGLYCKIDGTAGSLTWVVQDSSFVSLTLDGSPYVLIEAGEASDFEQLTLTLSGYQNTEDEDGWLSFFYDESAASSYLVSDDPFGSPPESGTWTIKEGDDAWQKIVAGGLWCAGEGYEARLSIEPIRKETDEALNDLAASVRDGCTLVVPAHLGNSDIWSVVSLLQGYSGVTVDLSETAITRIDSTLLNPGFKGCETLVAVVLPETLQEIGDEAFSGCLNLKAVEIPDAVESIGEYAFYNCRSLERFAAGAGLEQIGQFAFADCTVLKTVSLGTNVRSIGGSAFRNTGFAAIVLPKRLATIGDRAFSGGGLTSVEIPVSVKEIGEYAFYSCTKLEAAVLYCRTVGPAQFFGCTKLSRVVLGEGMKTIGDHAFYGCKSLQNVPLPQSLKTIKQAAFSNCEDLRSLEIPAGVVQIEEAAFFKCSSLREKNVVFAETGGWLLGPDFKSTSDSTSLATKLLDGLALKRDSVAQEDSGDGLVVIKNSA